MGRLLSLPKNSLLSYYIMTIVHLPRGPIMADVAAFHLDENEKQRLLDPAIGGVILFRRNFENIIQLKQLIQEIKSLRFPELIIAVDHEGGRVQRFINGFTRLPAMRVLGEIWDTHGETIALKYAEQIGWVLATELTACGIDLSFTPVLDLDWGQCAVIGNRSFHSNPHIVIALTLSLQKGLNRGGMKSCGKHFPGHGFVEGDSHHVLPEDTRTFSELNAADLQPFRALTAAGMAAIMPAHVIYPKIDAQPAGFSTYWLQHILRKDMKFTGVIFSDDLTMKGADGAGNIKQRTILSFAAGCDIALICNRPDLVDELRHNFTMPHNPHLSMRWQSIESTLPMIQAEKMMKTTEFKTAQNLCQCLATPKDLINGVKVGEAF